MKQLLPDMIHPFFTEIKNFPLLNVVVRQDIILLPEAHIPTGSIKAIVLGADPTNDGIPGDKGIKQLAKPFGIGITKYERWFFNSQKINLAAIGLSTDNVYVQNVCRNYFTCQTNQNKQWYNFAAVWIKYLREELIGISSSIPILATCEEVFTFLTGRKKPFTDIYTLKSTLPFYSNVLERNVFPLFRSTSYILHPNKWINYKNYLNNYFA